MNLCLSDDISSESCDSAVRSLSVVELNNLSPAASSVSTELLEPIEKPPSILLNVGKKDSH